MTTKAPFTPRVLGSGRAHASGDPGPRSKKSERTVLQFPETLRKRIRSLGPQPQEPSYAELAVTTNFSFLRGASHPAEMVAMADALGFTAIGIADRNTFAGVVRA